MAAKKKLSKTAMRGLVEAKRNGLAPRDGDSIAEAGRRSLALIAAYEAEGLGAPIKKLKPLQAFLAKHGALVVPAGKPWSQKDRVELAKVVGPLPNGLDALLCEGGLWCFRANPDDEIRMFDRAAMLAAREKMNGLLDRSPSEEVGEISSPIDDWAYPTSGTLPSAMRRDANLLPLAPYYGDHGAYFVALHLRDENGEAPVMLAAYEHGDVVVYGRSVAEWKTFCVRHTLTEIDWVLVS